MDLYSILGQQLSVENALPQRTDSAAGLPLSLQIAGRPFEEAVLLKIGDAYQRVTDWHLQEAPLIKSLVPA